MSFEDDTDDQLAALLGLNQKRVEAVSTPEVEQCEPPATDRARAPEASSPRTARDALIREMVGDLARIEEQISKLAQEMPTFSSRVSQDLEGIMSEAVVKIRSKISAAGNQEIEGSTKRLESAANQLDQAVRNAHILIGEEVKSVEREAYAAAARGVQEGIAQNVEHSVEPFLAEIREQARNLKKIAERLESSGRMGFGELFMVAVVAGIGAGIATIAMKLVAG